MLGRRSSSLTRRPGIDPFAHPGLAGLHGLPGLAPRKPRFPKVRRLGRALRWAGRRGWTHRRRLAPAYAAAVLTITADVTHRIHGGARTALSAAGLVALLILLWVVGRRRHGNPVPARRVWYLLATTATAGAWLAIASVRGLVPPLPGLLLVWAIAVGVPWWWHHRIRPVPVVSLPEAVALWDTLIGCDGGALPGATIDAPTPATAAGDGKTRIVVGWTTTIHLPPGRSSTDRAVNASRLIASAFGVPNSSVIVEPVPGGEEHLARLSVYTTNPLIKTRPWEGPHQLDAHTGIAPIGTYADGARATYRFWRPGSGPAHDLIAGATDGGKSRTVEMLLGFERHTSFIASVVIDPQRGQSLPEWRDAVALFADTAERGLAAVRAVRDEMYRRNELLARVPWEDDDGRPRRGISYFDPQSAVVRKLGLPLIVLTIEEAHAVLAIPEARSIVEDIAKMARKCGIKLRLVVQVPLLDQLGKSTTLREQVKSGNVIILRTANRLTGQVAFDGALPVDPALLPREWPDGTSTAGLSYVLGPQSRPAPCRIDYVADPYYWATTGTTTQLPEVLAAYERYVAEMEKPTAGKATAGTDASVQERVLAFVREHGQAATGVIAQALDLPLSTVTGACNRLAAAGALTKPRHGMWAAPMGEGPSDDTRAVDAELADAAASRGGPTQGRDDT